MKSTRLIPAILWLGLSLFVPAAVGAQETSSQEVTDQEITDQDVIVQDVDTGEVGADACVALTPGDPFQRYITIYNDSPVTVWPVMRSNIGNNCKDFRPANVNGLLQDQWRIHINKFTKGGGIPKDQSVTVAVPKCWPCATGGFYDAARMFVFLVNVEKFEGLIAPQPYNQVAAKTNPLNFSVNPTLPQPPRICVADPGKENEPDPCWIGTANTDYPLDAPVQLVEYTIESQNAAGTKNANTNDTTGVPIVDFDVSYVDSIFLPMAISVDNGSVQYMGSSLDYQTFKDRAKTFLKDGNWRMWNAYSPLYFNNEGQPGSTVFNSLLLETDPKPPVLIPSAAQTLQSLTGTSPFFAAAKIPKNAKDEFAYSTVCNDRKDHGGSGQFNLRCSETKAGDSPLVGDCCPSVNGVLGCCDYDKFILEGITRTYTPKSDNPLDAGLGTFKYVSEVQNDLVTRFGRWLDGTIACNLFPTPPSSNPPGPSGSLVAPVAAELQNEFCLKFKRTVRFVREAFKSDDEGRAKPICGPLARAGGQPYEECLLRLIIGYAIDPDQKTKFDNGCKSCNLPANRNTSPCNAFCSQEKLLNESVQALMRGVPWTATGGEAACGKCPNVPDNAGTCGPPRTGVDTVNQPLADCVFFDPNVSFPADARLYHIDKFLHYWPAYDSYYNLNPYARVVHCGPGAADACVTDPDGLQARGTYSFSIDDFYGNFGAPGSNLIVDVGSTKRLRNPEAFDPYKQYFVGVGLGWHHVWLCRDEQTRQGGRRFDIPIDPATGKGKGMGIPLSFYLPQADANGNPVRRDPCVVEIFARADESQSYKKFKVTETTTVEQATGRRYLVHDTLTGKDHHVVGLAGVQPDRLPLEDDPYCLINSTQDIRTGDSGACKGKVVPVGRGSRDGYSNVVENCARTDNLCGRPQKDLVVGDNPLR